MKVYYETNMERLPDNCKECTFEMCTLPLKSNTYKSIVKKKYLTKRHEECPLKVLKGG